MRRLLLLTLLSAATACVPHAPANAPGQEAVSLSGAPLIVPAIAPEARRRMEAELAEATAAWQKNPVNPDGIIWRGRRTAYLGRFREAIEIFTDGIRQHPGDPRMYRHRGHRYITTRQFDRAIRDLERAAVLMAGQPDQIEPDGQPNARNVPTSTLQSNVWYHLALARYLKGDYRRAADDWEHARAATGNADNLVAASHWLYLSMRRAGDDVAAANAVLARITPDLDIIENGSYHALLLLYKGERSADDVLKDAGAGSAGSAVRYGVGAWHAINGRHEDARQIWRTILEGTDWPSFGFIAAEAELEKLNGLF